MTAFPECVLRLSAMVTVLDEAIGHVTDALKKKGLYEDSVVVFMSDVSEEGKP